MPSALKRLLLILFIFSPALFTAKLVRDKSVDVGCWDQWENAPLLQKWHDGTLTWHDLFAPQIQHRIVVPRLMVIALTHLSGGDFRWENYATFAMVLLSAALLYRLLAKTLGDSLWVAALAFVANLLIFSPMLYQIFFWGSSLWMTIPMPCLLAILNILSTKPASALQPRPWWSFAAAILLAEIATLSFAHGILFWPILVTYILLQPSLATMQTRLILAGISVVIGAVTIICYFRDFYNVAHHAYSLKPGNYAMESTMDFRNAADRAKFFGFFLGFLGNPFARTPFQDHPLLSAESLGLWVLGAFISIALLIAFTKRGRSVWREALPWLALAAYVIGVALAISKGRSGIGEHRAVTTRYLVISFFLPISTLVLWFMYFKNKIIVPRADDEVNDPAASPAPGIIGACLLTGFAVMQIPQWSYGLHLTNIWHHARKQAQALVLFLPHIKPASLKVLDKDSRDWHCLDAINTLNQLHLLKFKPLETPKLKWFEQDKKTLPQEKAEITSALFNEMGELELTGTARFGPGQPADAVLIVRDGKVIALGQPAPKPQLRIYGLDYEFANVDELPVSSLYPWKGVIAPDIVPAEPATLELWALDVAAKRVTRLNVRLKVDKTAQTTEQIE